MMPPVLPELSQRQEARMRRVCERRVRRMMSKRRRQREREQARRLRVYRLPANALLDTAGHDGESPRWGLRSV